ncbi:Flagellar L-ring protein [Candidatus Sulfopaludibacter sp. SbA3]|nr:Flagellar L-ring protein [Candidatus Sulfopaludibacter sp. SbA3]
MKLWICWLCLSAPMMVAANKKKTEAPPTTPLDRYVAESAARSAAAPAATPGAIWLVGSRLADSARDVRASQVDDVLTIVVAEQASAVATGATKTQRSSSTKNSITALAGVTKSAGPWANLANLSGDTQLNGQGTTSRTTTLSTTLTARITHVLPNGGLVVEATKDIQVNSERQTITVRGVVRPADIDPTNSVQSNRLAQLEVHINGKGVVGDAIRRPFILYRILLGLLPF